MTREMLADMLGDEAWRREGGERWVHRAHARAFLDACDAMRFVVIAQTELRVKAGASA